MIENDCSRYENNERPNCADEFRLELTPEKAGTRSGILIHTGTDYNNSTGCLLPIGSSYTSDNEDFYINGEVESLTIYKSNGTSEDTLDEINEYVEKKKKEANKNNKTLKIVININR